MALVLADRVKENTSTTGTGALSLDGADNTFQSFGAVLSDGDTTYYGIVEPSTEEWEVGIGTYASGTNTLARTTILASSNSGSAINLTAGVAVVFLTQPSEKAVYKDVSGDTDLGTNASLSGYVDFTAIDHPTHAEGRVYFDDNHKTLSYQGDISGLQHEVGIEEHVRVYNNTGSTIAKGKPCYWSGNFVVSGGTDVPTVGLGNATDVSKYNVQGLAAHDIGNGQFGYIIVSGLVQGFDTSGLSAGDNFFVGLTDGAVQNASPTYPNYPMCLGWVIKSDATDGVVLVNQQNHSVNSFRVRTDAHVGGDLIVAGNLSVFGTTTSVSTENVSSGAAFNYLNAGDTIGEANTTFSGTGLDDAYFGGHFKGTANTTYYVRIDGTGTPDTFEWSKDNFATTEATGVSVNTAGNTLDNGITIEWGANTGHTLNDTWSGTAAPSNVDTGLFSNRNTGGSGVGYTHVGVFYDVSATEWALVGEYGPEPSGSINTSDSTFVYGDLRAGTIYGTFEGDITGDVTGNVSGNVTGSLTAGDNVKATFGAGSDLQVYHDGASGNSFISEIGTGNLKITGEDIRLEDASGNRYMQGVAGGASNLYYAGGVKLSSSATGVDINGILTSDGLTVDGTVTVNDTNARLYLMETDTTDLNTILRANNGDFLIQTITDNLSSSTSRLNIDHSTGDISFYEDTGTTPKFFWDASAESLGIKTDSPSYPLSVNGVVQSINQNNSAESILIGNDNTSAYVYTNAAQPMTFWTSNTERMRIDSSGNVTINSGDLDVTGTITSDGLTVDGDAVMQDANPTLTFRDTDGTSQETLLRQLANTFYISARNDSNDGNIVFQGQGGGTGTDRVKIAANGDISFYDDTGTTANFYWDASDNGRLGIGTTAPGSPIAIQQYANTNVNGLNGLRINAEGASNERYLGLGLYSTDGVVIAAGSAASEDTSIAFRTASAGTESEAGRFDPDGNLLMGKITTSTADQGIQINPAGRIDSTSDGAEALRLNRKTSDGDIIEFRKNNFPVGSIGTGINSGSSLYIGKGSVGLYFEPTGVDRIIPWDINTNAVKDASINLGASTERFKNLYLSGTLYAASKSFEIDHPTKEGMRLRHGSLEGPEDAVYVRGKLTGTDTIQLPDYWTGLVHEDSITVQLTAIGGKSDLWVKDIADNKVKVGCSTEINCFYFIQATRKDVEAWDVEYEA